MGKNKNLFSGIISKITVHRMKSKLDKISYIVAKGMEIVGADASLCLEMNEKSISFGLKTDKNLQKN